MKKLTVTDTCRMSMSEHAEIGRSLSSNFNHLATKAIETTEQVESASRPADFESMDLYHAPREAMEYAVKDRQHWSGDRAEFGYLYVRSETVSDTAVCTIICEHFKRGLIGSAPSRDVPALLVRRLKDLIEAEVKRLATPPPDIRSIYTRG